MDIKFEPTNVDDLSMPFLDLCESVTRKCDTCRNEAKDYIEHNQHFGRFINNVVTCSLECMHPHIKTCSFCHRPGHNGYHLFEMQNSIDKTKFIMSFCSKRCRKEFFGHKYEEPDYKFKDGYTFKVPELLCKRLMLYGLKTHGYKV